MRGCASTMLLRPLHFESGILLCSIISNHVQNTKLEEAVQESAAQNRQGKASGETGKESASAALSGRTSVGHSRRSASALRLFCAAPRSQERRFEQSRTSLPSEKALAGTANNRRWKRMARVPLSGARPAGRVIHRVRWKAALLF